MKVRIHLLSQSEPVEILDARNAYTKGALYCVMASDGKTVYKFPIEHVFRVTEVSTENAS